MKANNNSTISRRNVRQSINDAFMRVMLLPKELIYRYFPQRLRHFYWLALSGMQVLILYGWKSFFRRYRRYTLNKKNVLEWQRQLEYGVEMQGAVEIEPGQYRMPEKARVAVVVHAYYAELYSQLCSYLRNMPCPFTLLVSVKDEDDRQLVIQQSLNLPLLTKAIVKVVENRGRDIKPFLVDFADELSDFDYICKLHIKKSLYTGMEKTDRRQYLFKMVLGSKQRAQAIMTVFARDRNVGIIYPARYEEMTYWGYTWLSNKWIAAPYVNRLGFDFDPDEYIDYPSGSMFWMKKDALKPLLDMHLTVADFPEEKGQNDGELQHVLERCLVLSTHASGYKYAVMTDLSKDVFSYSDAMKISPYFNVAPAERIRDLLNVVDLVSYDIFDTLLCRPFASPDKVLQYLEEIVQQRYRIKGFMRFRQESEAEIRRKLGQSGDAKISQIYQVLAGKAGISQETAGQLMELELATEIALLVPRQEMLASFEGTKKAGKRVILTSDTYFERQHIERILAAKGITGYHRLYISCEEGRRKSRGDMWDHVLQQEGVSVSSLAHVGDNEQSDAQMLGDRGCINIVHVMKPSVLFRQSVLGQFLWHMLSPRKGWRENLLYGLISNHFCLNTYPYEFWYSQRPLGAPYSLGYAVFGPLMHNFMAWLVNTVRADGVKHLHFLSREGYVLQKMYDAIAGSAAFQSGDLNLPSGSYLLCSRRACLFAGLRGQQDLMPFLDRGFTGTLRYFFEKRLNVSKENMDNVERTLGSHMLKREVSLPADHGLVRKSLLAVFDILASQAQREREELLSYYRARGMIRGGKIGLVDIGYSLTIQKALIKLLEIPLNGYYLAIDTDAGKIEDRNSQARAYLGEPGNQAVGSVGILKYRLLLESVLTSPDGQLLNFAAGKDGAVPVFKPGGLSQKNFDVISRIQAGMQAFVQDMLDLFGTDMLKVEFPAQELLSWYQMVATGTIDLGELKSALSVEDEYCGYPEIAVIDHYMDTDKQETD